MPSSAEGDISKPCWKFNVIIDFRGNSARSTPSESNLANKPPKPDHLAMTMQIDRKFLDLLCCPRSGRPVTMVDDRLVSEGGGTSYALSAEGIPLFAEEFCSDDARIQRAHYAHIADDYLTNLQYPHTQEYIGYLDDALSDAVGDSPLGTVAEICCGRGEALALYGDKTDRAIGVDITLEMLSAARETLQLHNCFFVQGDATTIPLTSGTIDTVFMLGGIHHVRDRVSLFGEVARILKPGGRFIWREPVSDFFVWRGLRAIIYRLSPHLDHETEAPLLWDQTVPVLDAAGFTLERWKTYGFIGFCLFMNSDVLVFNRLFRFIPGIRAVTRWVAKIDDLITRCPPFRRAGLQVVGVARRN